MTKKNDPCDVHFLLTADASKDVNPMPRVVYCESDGTITLVDSEGTALPYVLVAGQIIPFRARRVSDISGGTFYGWT